MMPHDQTAEAALLSLCLRHPETMDGIIESCSQPVELFHLVIHREIWKRFERLRAKSSPLHLAISSNEMVADPVPVTEWGAIETEWCHPANFEHMMEVAIEFKNRRAMVDLGMKMTSLAKEASKPFSETIGECSRAVFSMEDVKEQKKTNSQILREVVDEWEWALNNPGELIGIGSGFKNLDDITSGFQARSLNIIGARPSTGKTAFLCNVLGHIAVKNGIPCLFFSLESSAKEILRRLILIRGELDGNRLRSGRFQNGDVAVITSGLVNVGKSPLMIVDNGSLTVAQIRAVARSAVRNHGIKFIALDYVQKIALAGKSDKRTYEVGHNSSELKEMAKELNVPVLAAGQLNRESEKDKGREPRTSDLADSDQIIRDADLIGLLHRVPRRDDLPAEFSEIDLIIGKQRDGRTGRLSFLFKKNCTRFEVKTE